MGVDVCDKNAAQTPNKVGLIVVGPDSKFSSYTFMDLKRLSNQLANFFIACGLTRGERVGILMSQSLEVAISHVAAWKIAAISIPLFTLFGQDRYLASSPRSTPPFRAAQSACSRARVKA